MRTLTTVGGWVHLFGFSAAKLLAQSCLHRRQVAAEENIVFQKGALHTFAACRPLPAEAPNIGDHHAGPEKRQATSEIGYA
eukprot:13774956-Alexandrium_andersonii.AAC.1